MTDDTKPTEADAPKPSLLDTIIPADPPPVEDTPNKITEAGEPAKPKNRGGRPRLTDAEREKRDEERRLREEARRQEMETPSEVRSALTVLQTFYDVAAMGLSSFGAPNAAQELVTKTPSVMEQNKLFLSTNRPLAARIAKIGASTGSGGFLLTNLMLLASVGMTAGTELSMKYGTGPKPKRSATQTARERWGTAESVPPDATPVFPGGVPPVVPDAPTPEAIWTPDADDRMEPIPADDAQV